MGRRPRSCAPRWPGSSRRSLSPRQASPAARRPADRRVAILMPDCPGAPGRTGYAVGLDVPASVCALLADLAAAGYAVHDAPQTPRELLDALARGAHDAALTVADYARLAANLPAD